MEIIYFLLPLSLCLAIVALVGFVWGVRKNQFDDVDSASMRMLFDEPTKKPTNSTPSDHQEDCNQ